MLIKKGATDVIRYIMVVDSADGSPETGATLTSFDLQYVRVGASPAAKVDATALAAIDSAHGDNKIFEVDSTSSPGLYRVDWPDAAFASGASHVILVVTQTGFAPAVEEIQLVDVDPEDQYWGADAALVLRRLDHLVAVADSDDPVDNSIIAKMASKAGTANWSDFDNTTDSLEAVRDDQLKVTTGFSTGNVKDTLEGYIKAVMLNDATVPTNTPDYVPSTDSLEALGAGQTDMKGSSFATGTDSLAEIRDAIDTLIAPSIVSSSALSGSGFLSDSVSLVRKLTDEPDITPKYTDADMVEFIQTSFGVVLADVNVNSDHPILVRYNIQLVSGTLNYLLPPQVGEIWRVAKIVSGGSTPIYESWPDNHWSSHQSGFVIEGNVFRLLRDWKSSDVLEILFVPMGEPLLHKATSTTGTATTLTFPSSATDGTLDTRANAYAGYVLHVLPQSGKYEEERTITAYNHETRIATVSPAFTNNLTAGCVYEVLPSYSRLLKHVVCLQAALDILGAEGNTKRMETLAARLMIKQRALRMLIAKKSSRFPGHMEGDTSDSSTRGGYYGWLV